MDLQAARVSNFHNLLDCKQQQITIDFIGQPLSRRPAPSPLVGHHVNHSHGHIHSSQILRTSGGNQHVHSHIHAELDTASHLSSSRFDIDWEAKEVDFGLLILLIIKKYMF